MKTATAAASHGLPCACRSETVCASTMRVPCPPAFSSMNGKKFATKNSAAALTARAAERCTEFARKVCSFAEQWGQTTVSPACKSRVSKSASQSWHATIREAGSSASSAGSD